MISRDLYRTFLEKHNDLIERKNEIEYYEIKSHNDIKHVIKNNIKYVSINDDNFKSLKRLIPNSVTYLKLDIISQLEQDVIPSSVKHLFIGNSYNKPILPGVIPNTVREIIFGLQFNQIIEEGVIPYGVITVEFGTNFNAKFVLPNTIKCLKFGWKFNQQLKSFYDSFDRNSECVIPNSVTHLSLSNNFDKPLKPGVIPFGVTSLHLGYYFDQELEVGSIPNSVKILHMGFKFNRKLTVGIIPNSVEILHLGGYFNHSFEYGIIPNSVVFLVLSIMFNQIIKPGDIPNSVIYLYFGTYFSKVINDENIPKSVRHINLILLNHIKIDINAFKYIDSIFISMNLYEIINIEKLKEMNKNILICLHNSILDKCICVSTYLEIGINDKYNVDKTINKNKLIGKVIYKELTEKIFSPNRLIKICGDYNIELYELLNIYRI